MYRIGIDLGGTNIAAGLVDESMRIVDKASVSTRAPRPMADLADDIAALVRKLLERGGLDRQDLAAVGVGVPGTANRENGHLEDANNLGFDDEPFLPVLEVGWRACRSASATTPTRRPGGSTGPETIRRTPSS